MNDQLPAHRHPIGQEEYEPAQRIDVLRPLLVGEDRADPRLELLDRGARIGDQGPVRSIDQLRSSDYIVLVLYLAHDLLDQIFDGDDSVDAAKFVDHQGHVHVL